MDLLDRKLLALLDENARTPSSVLAKKVGKSRQVVDYRIRQLVENKIILHFTAFVDPTKFYRNIWHVHLKLESLTQEIETQIFDLLLSMGDVWWVTQCAGEWDLIFSVVGNELMRFDEFLSDFRSQFHTYINDILVTSLIIGYLYARGHFLGEPTRKKLVIAQQGTVCLSESDLLVLKTIVPNARMSYTKIAELTRLTTRQVMYKIKEFQKKGIIKAFRLHLNYQKLGFDYYKVCFYTKDFSEEYERAILSWCEKNPFVLCYDRKISPWTFEIEFETHDYKTLNKILREMRNTFGNFIKKTETTLISEEFKGELNPLLGR